METGRGMRRERVCEVKGRANKHMARHWVVLIAVLAAGCATVSVPVTGKNGQGATPRFDQSETALSASSFWGRSIITATFNDATDTAATILYSSSTRTVLKGASLLGWSYSTDGGTSWSYGGKVAPPEGWAVLWGSPAITRSEFNQRYVFISNLAVPSKKFPASGASGPLATYMGGACIVRSTDGGVTFQQHQCIHNNYDYYDGGSMAAGPGREIYAAYLDVPHTQIDVWMSLTETDTFSKLPNPFPGQEMWSHPRLRVDSVSGALYVAAVCVLPSILVRRFNVPFFFGGTALLIVVGVALDTVAQIETHMLTRSYQGFMKRGRMRGRRG